jgi:hypothetical protein
MDGAPGSVVFAGNRSYVRLLVGNVIKAAVVDVKAPNMPVAFAVKLPLSDGAFSC